MPRSSRICVLVHSCLSSIRRMNAFESGTQTERNTGTKRACCTCVALLNPTIIFVLPMTKFPVFVNQ